MEKHLVRPLSGLKTSFTRRELLTRVAPAGLAVTLLGTQVSTASAQVLKKSFPPFVTNVAPGAAAYNNYAMVTATSPAGHILYNWWQLGGEKQQWREIEGNGQTDATPAAAFWEIDDVNGDSVSMFSAIKGLDGNIYTNYGSGFGNFKGWVQLPGLQTNVAPTVAFLNDWVTSPGEQKYPVIVATATDGRIFYHTMPGNQSGWVEMQGNGRTDVSPAAMLLNAYGSPYLYVIIKGLDGHLYYNGGTLGQHFSGWIQVEGFTTNVAPVITSSGDPSAVVATRTDGRIFYYWYLTNGIPNWTELECDVLTDAAPAAALVSHSPLVGNNSDNGYLYVIIKGLDGYLYINQGDLGKPFVGWQLL